MYLIFLLPRVVQSPSGAALRHYEYGLIRRVIPILPIHKK